LVFSQPIQHAIEQAATDANVDISHWTPARIRGIWSRTAKDWNKRATDAGVLWGTKPGTQTRSAEISTKIQTIDGDFLSCRPLERTNSSPCLLPTLPEQVFILTVASETMVTRNGKIQVYVDGPLSLNLKISKRLVRACIFSSFQRPASIYLYSSRDPFTDPEGNSGVRWCGLVWNWCEFDHLPISVDTLPDRVIVLVQLTSAVA
jgi:hypothetical protein